MRHMLLILTALDNPFVFGLVMVFSIVLFFGILILVVKIWTERSQDKYTAMARDRKKIPRLWRLSWRLGRRPVWFVRRSLWKMVNKD